MDFFNKYKDLFGVPQGLSVPQSRLLLNNDLFIEKTYIPTKTQQYSLNGKLRELRKDYTQLEHNIDQMSRMRLTPKRTSSRKGTSSNFKSATYNQKYNQNKQSKVSVPTPPRHEQPKYDLSLEKKRLLNDMKKRQNWFKEESNILKHSELDHIFSNKLNNVYDLDQIKTQTLPKPDIQFDLGYSLDHKRPKQAQFSIKQRSKPHLQTKLNQDRVEPNNAIARREKAKNNLEFRRKKLEQLLRTLW